jgi:cell division protein FtsA
MGKREEIIVGLDIGTSKVTAVVGEVSDDEVVDIIGIGSHPSRGLVKGVVVNIENTVTSINKAIEEAEQMAGCEISTVYASISGGHIQGLNSTGIVAVKPKGGEISQSDVDRVLEAAKAIPITPDREILHTIPQEYVVDAQDGVRDPIGISGVRLEARVHIVTAAVMSAQNIIKCTERCGLTVADIVLGPLASADACLHDDERELGVALVDIGGGTCDIVIYVDGAVVHTAVLTLGGQLLTNDIAVGLRTPTAEAEAIKQRYGCAMSALVDAEETIEVPGVGGRPSKAVPRQHLCGIIEPRVEEIFALVQRKITETGYADLLASGVVLTGGATILEGMDDLAEEVLGMPVRRGTPIGVGGLVDVVRSPVFTTGAGLVLWGAKHSAQEVRRNARGGSDKPARPSMLVWVRDWFREVF